MTKFCDFPMESHVASYRSHRELNLRFRNCEHFGTSGGISSLAPRLVSFRMPLGEFGEGWRIHWRDGDGRRFRRICRTA